MEPKERSWADLPSDILSLVHSHLIVVDSPAFCAVCRPWQSSTRSVRNFYPAVDSSLCESPCLMSLNGSLCKFYHPMYNATYRMDIPELSGMRIRSSNFGWLLLDKGLKICFFNPFTKERIDLPDIDIPNIDVNRVSRFHFSSPPTSPDCTVTGILLPCLHNDETIVYTIKRGEPGWKLLWLGNDAKDFFRSSRCAPVFLNGKYYFLGETCNIAVFDVEDESWEIFDEKYTNRYVVWPRSLLVENDGSETILLAVFLIHEFRKVHVARFDVSKMVWEEVDSLGSDKMLYLSDGASYLETSSVRGTGNRIYFPQFHKDNGVFYSLATRKYHSFDGSYGREVPEDLQEPRLSTWIKPLYTEGAAEDLIWCDQLAS